MDPISRVSYTDMVQQAKYSDKTITEHAKNTEMNMQDVIINDVKPIQTQTSSGNQDAKSGEKKEETASEKQIRDAISKVNKKLMNRTKCEFSYHEETKRVSIKVIDEDTKEVIREIPPEETLDMVQKVWELAGILIDEKR